MMGDGKITDSDFLPTRARQLPKFTETEMFAQSLLGIVVNTGRIVNALRLGDIAARQQFTQRVAREAFGRSGGRAVIVCNVGFATTGNIFSRTTQRYDANLGADVTFEVVVLERGASFTRQGDGGFENVSRTMERKPESGNILTWIAP